jgi:hypothetical protein
MRSLLEDLHFSRVETEVQKNAKHNLIDYLFANVSQHQVYASSYFICEVLNAINILGQIFLVDTFLGGEFLEYGGNVLSQSTLDPEDRTDPMSYVKTFLYCTCYAEKVLTILKYLILGIS